MGIVRAVCVFIAQNARRKKGVLSEDIAAILLCTALYLHPKSSHALYVQYKRAMHTMLNIEQFHVTEFINRNWNLAGLRRNGSSIQTMLKSAYSVRFHCADCALKQGCFIRRYPAILVCTALYL